MFSQFMGAMLSAPMAATNEVVEAVVGGYDRYDYFRRERIPRFVSTVYYRRIRDLCFF